MSQLWGPPLAGHINFILPSWIGICVRFYFFVVLVFSSNVEIFAFCAVGSMFNLKTVFDSKKNGWVFLGRKKVNVYFGGNRPWSVIFGQVLLVLRPFERSFRIQKIFQLHFFPRHFELTGYQIFFPPWLVSCSSFTSTLICSWLSVGCYIFSFGLKCVWWFFTWRKKKSPWVFGQKSENNPEKYEKFPWPCIVFVVIVFLS